MSTVTVKAEVLVRTLSNVVPFADTGRDAYAAISVVHVEAGNGVITATATDRFTMGHARGEANGAMGGTSIRLPDVKRILDTLKGAAKADAYAILTLSGETPETQTLTVACDVLGTSVTVAPEFEAFPRYRRLFPTEHEVNLTVSAAFNAAYMARFAKVKVDRGVPMRIVHASPQKPMVVEIGDSFVGIIMPVKNAGESIVPIGLPDAAPSEPETVAV